MPWVQASNSCRSPCTPTNLPSISSDAAEPIIVNERELIVCLILCANCITSIFRLIVEFRAQLLGDP